MYQKRSSLVHKIKVAYLTENITALKNCFDITFKSFFHPHFIGEATEAHKILATVQCQNAAKE